MPFQNADGTMPATPILRVVSRERFQLVKDLVYVRGTTTVSIPHHTPDLTGQSYPVLNDQNSTDLATIPWLFTSLLARYGRQTLPALMHDALCVQVDALQSQERTARDVGKKQEATVLREKAWALRGQADYLFFCALKDQEVPLFRRTEFWAGVTLGKYAGAGKPLALVLMVLHVVTAAGPWLLLAGNWIPTPTVWLWAATVVFAIALLVRIGLDRDAHVPLVAVIVLPGLLVYVVGWLVGAVSLNLVTLLMNPVRNLQDVVVIFKPTHL